MTTSSEPSKERLYHLKAMWKIAYNKDKKVFDKISEIMNSSNSIEEYYDNYEKYLKEFLGDQWIDREIFLKDNLLIG
jgi:hypothetical protein